MLLEAKNISYAYTKNGRKIFDGFSLSMESNERVGIIAPSGFGKTTFCQIVSGYLKPTQGQVLLDGKPLAEYQGYCPVQLIYQHPEKAINPRMRMKDVLLEGDKVEPRIIEALGIEPDWLNRFPNELSGGEMQRFCIARALGERTKFILADEISTMLDLITQSQIWNFLLKETTRRQIGILAVSHSSALMERICTRQIFLEE